MSNPVLKTVACLTFVVMMAAPVARAEQKQCGGDNKLISDSGAVRIATDLAPDSWWGIIYQGLQDTGYVTDAQKLAFLNNLFATSFSTLTEMAIHELGIAQDYDKNGNSVVCIANIRGTRTSYGDPNFANYFFFIWDDREFKNPN